MSYEVWYGKRAGLWRFLAPPFWKLYTQRKISIRMSLLRSPAPYSSLFKLNKLRKNVTLFVSWHFWADVIRWLTSFKSIGNDKKANALKKQIPYLLSSAFAKNYKISEKSLKLWKAFKQFLTTISKIGSYTTWITGILYLP